MEAPLAIDRPPPPPTLQPKCAGLSINANVQSACGPQGTRVCSDKHQTNGSISSRFMFGRKHHQRRTVDSKSGEREREKVGAYIFADDYTSEPCEFSAHNSPNRTAAEKWPRPLIGRSHCCAPIGNNLAHIRCDCHCGESTQPYRRFAGPFFGCGTEWL